MKKPSFKQVSIVGVGLIGGSLGLAIKKHKLADKVVGVGHRKESLQEAKTKRAIDWGTTDLKEGVKGSDLVILCSPISTIVKHLKELDSLLEPKAIVMDVGSSKGEIVETAKNNLKNATFIGCHPMAGSEKQGVRFASADLFERSICFVTEHHEKVKHFWEWLGATPLKLDARSHDEWVAKASHLPHLLAFALFQKINLPPSTYIPLNPSFKSFARLAKSDPKIWADILLSNQANILAVIKELKKELTDAEEALKNGNKLKIAQFIQKANLNSELFHEEK